MSACHLTFRFYLDDAEARARLHALLGDEPDPEEAIALLGLDDCVDEDSEHVEDVSLKAGFLELSFMNSTSAPFNHALVRRFKELGSEFCHVDEFNDQVGESAAFYLHRGKRPDAATLEGLIERHGAIERLAALFEGPVDALRRALDDGLDSNRRIDGEPLPLLAWQAGNKAAFDLLLERGADANALDEDGRPLLIAVAESVERDEEGYLAALVEHGADPDVVDEDGVSFLWLLGRADRALRARLVERGVPFSRPASAYEDEDDMRNLDTAIRHADEERVGPLVATFLLDAARHDELAALLCAHDRRDHLEALFVLKYSPGASTFEELLENASWGPSLDALDCLLAVADRRGIDLGSVAGELIERLAEHPTAEPLIARLLARHPGSCSRYALYNAVEGGANEVLVTLLADRAATASLAADAPGRGRRDGRG